VRIAFFHHTPFPSNRQSSHSPLAEKSYDTCSVDLVFSTFPRYANNFARSPSAIRRREGGWIRCPVAEKFRRNGSALAEPSLFP